LTLYDPTLNTEDTELYGITAFVFIVPFTFQFVMYLIANAKLLSLPNNKNVGVVKKSADHILNICN
jgi:hypothetical protein